MIGKEERAKARGMSEKDLKRSISSKYIANEDDNESVVEYIKLHHAFAVGVLIDEYYWLHAAPPYRRPPLLPQLLPTLLTDYALPPAQKTDLLAQLADFYTQLYDLLRKNGGLESPEPYLELADVYLQLEAPDKARQALEQSARALLQNRCVPSLPNADTAGLAFLTQELALPYLSEADGAFLAGLAQRMRQITDLADFHIMQIKDMENVILRKMEHGLNLYDKLKNQADANVEAYKTPFLILDKYKNTTMFTARANEVLGYLYWTGLGTSKNIEMAFKLYQKSAEQGFEWGQLGIAELYFEQSKYDEGFIWLQKAIENGLGMHGYQIWGDCYRDGKGVEPNMVQAFKYYEKAAELGNHWGYFCMGAFLQEGTEMIRKDSSEAEKMFETAKKMGNIHAERKLEELRQAKCNTEEAETTRIAEAKRIAEEKRHKAEAARLAEEQRKAETAKRVAEQKRREAEAVQITEEQRKAETAKQVAEQKRLEAEAEANRQAELARIAEQKQLETEAAHIAEETCKPEEKWIAFFNSLSIEERSKAETAEQQASLKIKNSQNAKELDLSFLGLRRVPESIKNLKQLTMLNLSGNQLNDVSSLRDLKQLTTLNLFINELSDISALRDLKQLTTLNLVGNKLCKISALRDLKQLATLNLVGNEIKNFNLDLALLPNLEELNLRGNPIQNIPEEILEADNCAAAIREYQQKHPLTADEIERRKIAAHKQQEAEAEAARLVEEKRKKEEAERRKAFAPKMILVQGGTFEMGSGGGWFSNSRPIHQVTLNSFMIGKYPITQAQWKAVMGNNPSHFKGDDLPVETVSYDDIQEFLCKLNQLTGKTYSLPTEAQWEFAARGGNKSKGYEYSGSNHLNEVGWFNENSGSQTRSVGTKAANELGIHDMSGNVWEWCADWYDSYSSAAVTNPTGAAMGARRVLRGGSWSGDFGYCRVAYRFCNVPSNRILDYGFRVVSFP